MSKAKILVVDDDPKLSRLVKAYLENTRLFEVQEENRSSQAVATARAFQPNAILLDIDMPGKDGGQVAQELSADPTLAKTPVMFLTSLISGLEAGQYEIERGGKRYLAKPVNPSVLIRAVHRLLEGSAAQSV